MNKLLSNSPRLSVATNFENGLLDKISSYPVEDVYGKLTGDCVGGGRASYTTQGIGFRNLKNHIACAHKNRIKFNYLLNTACLGNREWTRKGKHAIRRLLDRLSDTGVDSITVSIPYLAELIKKNYPHFFLKIGIFANIDSPERARFWEGLGADMLTLESFSINRNFPLLEAIKESVSCRLQLILNFTCLPRCAMQPYHMTGLSHASNTKDRAPFFDYSVLKCTSMLLKEPGLLIKSQWIRPEDIKHYLAIGYSDFKILERNAPTDVLADRVRAYTEGASPQNLLVLLQPFGFPEKTRTERGWFLKYFFPFLKEPLGFRDVRRLLERRGLLYPLKEMPVLLDSAKIPDDFLEEIRTRDCSLIGGCSRCGYCGRIAESAYHVDERYKKECIELYERVFERLCSR